jgi:cobalt-zinc-cadmium efflux system outer membrane protein
MRITSLILIGWLAWTAMCGGEPMAAAPRAVEAPADPATVPPPLTLPEALARVLRESPALAVTALEAEALEGRVRQAGRSPNPELSAEFENFLGTGDLWWAAQAELTVQMERRFERGGKRQRRVELAQAERALAVRAQEAHQAEQLAEATRLFVGILAIQDRLANRRELAGVAAMVHQIVAERVSAGKVAPVEETRAAVALASARLEADRLRRELLAECDRLAALWGAAGADFETVAPAAGLTPPAGSQIPAAEVSAPNPEMLRLEAEELLRAAELARETSERTPDFTVSAGVRYLQEVRDVALVAGLTLPLPLADKRQGAIAEAGVRLRQSGIARQAAAHRLRAELAQARRAYDSAAATAHTLEQTILPEARGAFDILQEGYRQGKTDYLDVLDAQRTFFELRGAQIEAMAETQRAVVEVLRLTGRIRDLAAPDAP